MEESQKCTVKPSLFMLYVVGSSLLGSISLGLTVGYTSSAIPSMESNLTIPKIFEPNDEDTKSWIKSIISIGAMVGALSAGPVANMIGRKAALIIANVPFFFGWMSIAFASGPGSIIIGRLATGFCVGFVCTVVPLYLIEISPLHMRGLIGSTFQASIIGGILLSSMLGVFLEWRQLAFVSSLPCLIMPLCMLFSTESPAYLINQKSKDNCSSNNNNNNNSFDDKNSKKTLKVLQRLRAESSDIQGELIELGSTLCQSPADETKMNFSWETIRQSQVSRPLLLTLGIMFYQQFSGITPVTFSMVEIFTLSRISLNGSICSVIVNSVSFVATSIACLLADKCGRKPLLLLSGLLHVISLSTLGLSFYLLASNPEQGSTYGIIALIALMLLVTGFAMGYGCLPWVVISEFTVYEARGLVNSFGTFACWTFIFLLTKSFETLQRTLKPYGLYWLLAIISSTSIPFIAFFVPETKGKSSESVASQFKAKIFLDVPCTNNRY